MTLYLVHFFQFIDNQEKNSLPILNTTLPLSLVQSAFFQMRGHALALNRLAYVFFDIVFVTLFRVHYTQSIFELIQSQFNEKYVQHTNKQKEKKLCTVCEFCATNSTLLLIIHRIHCCHQNGGGDKKCRTTSTDMLDRIDFHFS